MIQHVWSIICQNGSVDSESGSISLFNILETITVYSEPKSVIKLPFQFEVFSLWVKTEGEVENPGRMRILYCDPSDKCKTKVELQIEIGEQIFYRTRVKAEGLTLHGPGMYKIVVELQNGSQDKWVPVATIPFLVIFDPPEASGC